jgi:glycosyltransferase involved in cell wall biosynthesis
VVGTLAHPAVVRHVTDLARALGGGRYRVHVYGLAEAAEAAVARLSALGIAVTTLSRRHSYEPGRIVALARAFRRDGIDLVHAILPAGAAYGALAARLAGIPIVVVSSRAGDPSEDRRIRGVLHRVYRRATAVLTNTRAQARQLATEADVPLAHVRVVYDGVDLTRHVPGMLDGLRERVRHRPLLIGGAGCPQSGRPVFLAAAARIAARHPDAHFVWLDDAPSSGGRSKADEPSGPPVTIVPIGSDPDPVLSQLAMLCLAGNPGCPTLDLVPTAMAAGRPIVATHVPGIDELVADGATGMVVPTGDAEAFSAAALGLLEDRGRLRHAGQAARAHAERAFGAAGMARATAAVYEASLLGQLGTVPAAASREGRH